MFASRYVYLLCLLCFLCWFLFFFFENSLLFIFLLFQKKGRPFSFVHPFFVKLFLFHLLCCFAPFPVCFCFFNRVLSNKINWLFSFGRKTTCLIPPRTYFLNFCYLPPPRKSLSSFFSFFSKFPFSKNCLFWISEKIPHKIGFKNKMIVQISLSGNLFVFRKKPSLQPLQKNVFLSSPSCVFYRSKKVFLKKSHSKKLFSWRKTKLLLSPLDFGSIFILSKNSFLFFSCPFFFACSFFSGVCFSKQKKVKQISFEKIWVFFFSKHFLLNFFWGRNIFWSKKECAQKLSFEFSSKKISLKEKKTYFKIHTRWGSRARMKALLTIAACRAVVERVKSMCIQLSFISAAGHPSHQAISLLFFCFSFCSF